MKIRSILFASAALAVLASCAGKVSDITEIKGEVLDGEIIAVTLQYADVDTLVPVIDGRFAIDVPTDLTSTCKLTAGNSAAIFILDGTPLKVVVDQGCTVTSKYPKVSAQEKYTAYNIAENALMDEYMAVQREILANTELSAEEQEAQFETYYDEFIVGYKDHQIASIKANPDNFVAIFALNNLIGQLEDDELNELIAGLSPEVQENQYVKAMKVAADARLNTQEGKMFTDFTINTVTGMTRSIPPQPKYKEVKFSDYVGKGKYILVDFWAPWCGPCRQEVPNLQNVHKKYAGKDFDILSIAVWERQPVDVTLDTAVELGMDWLHINSAGSIPTDLYGIEGIPHIILFGPDGTILKRNLRGEAIGEEIAKYLGK